MIPINGNTTVTVQTRTVTKNSIGEGVKTWTDAGTVLGWLDYAGGQNDVGTFKGKVQDTSHLFFCDYDKWDSAWTAENIRIVDGTDIYSVLQIDNPMGMNEHLEIYLKYIGGGLGAG